MTSTAGRSTSPAGSRSWSTGSRLSLDALGGAPKPMAEWALRARGGRGRADRDLVARRVAAGRAAADPRRRVRRGRLGFRRPVAARGAGAARRAAAGPADARELPHRLADDLHAGADAVGAASRRVPARPRRRGVPAQGAARRRRPAARRPARRRARPARRGPPAPARRAPRRARPADHHVHRQRRADEHRQAAGRAGGRAARRRGPDGLGRRAGRRPPPAPALRPAQLRRPAVELRPRHAGGGAGADRVAAGIAAVPVRAAAAAGARSCSRSRTWCGSPSIRRGRSCASAWASASATSTTRSTMRCRSSSTGSRSGRSATGSSARGSSGTEVRAACLAEIARGALPPGVLGKPVLEDVVPTVEAIVAAASEVASGPGVVRGRHGRARGPDAERDGARRPR